MAAAVDRPALLQIIKENKNNVDAKKAALWLFVDLTAASSAPTAASAAAAAAAPVPIPLTRLSPLFNQVAQHHKSRPGFRQLLYRKPEVKIEASPAAIEAGPRTILGSINAKPEKQWQELPLKTTAAILMPHRSTVDAARVGAVLKTLYQWAADRRICTLEVARAYSLFWWLFRDDTIVMYEPYLECVAAVCLWASLEAVGYAKISESDLLSLCNSKISSDSKESDAYPLVAGEVKLLRTNLTALLTAPVITTPLDRAYVLSRNDLCTRMQATLPGCIPSVMTDDCSCDECGMCSRCWLFNSHKDFELARETVSRAMLDLFILFPCDKSSKKTLAVLERWLQDDAFIVDSLRTESMKLLENVEPKTRLSTTPLQSQSQSQTPASAANGAAAAACSN